MCEYPSLADHKLIVGTNTSASFRQARHCHGPASSSSHVAPTNRPTPPKTRPVLCLKPHGVVGVGEREWGNFLSLLWIITVPQSTDNLSYRSNAVFQSYIYMLCGIWPASILLNKVLRLSTKKEKKITYLSWMFGIRWNAWTYFTLSYALFDNLWRGWLLDWSVSTNHGDAWISKIALGIQRKYYCEWRKPHAAVSCNIQKYGLFWRNPLESVCHQVSLPLSNSRNHSLMRWVIAVGGGAVLCAQH